MKRSVIYEFFLWREWNNASNQLVRNSIYNNITRKKKWTMDSNAKYLYNISHISTRGTLLYCKLVDILAIINNNEDVLYYLFPFIIFTLSLLLLSFSFVQYFIINVCVSKVSQKRVITFIFHLKNRWKIAKWRYAATENFLMKQCNFFFFFFSFLNQINAAYYNDSARQLCK